MAASSIIKIGPWGGNGAFNFDVGEHVSHITKIIVYTDDVVDSLEIYYVDDQNKSQIYRTGGTDGAPHEFELESGEYINWVVLSYKKYFDEVCISELQFKTNLRNDYGPYGQEGDQMVTIPIAAGRVVGFFGQSNRYINSIGVCVAPN